MYCKNEKTSLYFGFVAGIVISIFVPMEVSAQAVDVNAAVERCSELTTPGSAEQATCVGCVLVYMATNTDNPDPKCNAYLSLNKPIASQPIQAIDSAEIEKDVAEQMVACNKNFALNCQCWEKEYREGRAKGLRNYEVQPTSHCYSKDRIKAYAYPRCVRFQWNTIEQFDSYCGCVAEDFAASIIEHGEAYENAAVTDAAKACNLSQQERLTPERGKERYEKYGRRGPTLDPHAYRKVL